MVPRSPDREWKTSEPDGPSLAPGLQVLQPPQGQPDLVLPHSHYGSQPKGLGTPEELRRGKGGIGQHQGAIDLEPSGDLFKEAES